MLTPNALTKTDVATTSMITPENPCFQLTHAEKEMAQNITSQLQTIFKRHTVQYYTKSLYPERRGQVQFSIISSNQRSFEDDLNRHDSLPRLINGIGGGTHMSINTCTFITEPKNLKPMNQELYQYMVREDVQPPHYNTRSYSRE